MTEGNDQETVEIDGKTFGVSTGRTIELKDGKAIDLTKLEPEAKR